MDQKFHSQTMTLGLPVGWLLCSWLPWTKSPVPDTYSGRVGPSSKDHCRARRLRDGASRIQHFFLRSLKKILVGRLLGAPREVLFGLVRAWRWVARLMPQYFEVLPPSTQGAVMDRANKAGGARGGAFGHGAIFASELSRRTGPNPEFQVDGARWRHQTRTL